jgi:predicted glycoside hydrolase/deacetylase ChbG (UPF0249 family)
LVLEAARQLQIPVRHFTPRIRFCGDFYGQTGDGKPLPESITPSRFAELLEALPPGITEIGCHPGYADDLNTMYRFERRQEIETLCSKATRRAVTDAHVKLISFSQVPVTV